MMTYRWGEEEEKPGFSIYRISIPNTVLNS